MLMMEFTEPANRKEIEASIQPFLNFLLSGKEIPLKSIAKKLEQDNEAKKRLEEQKKKNKI